MSAILIDGKAVAAAVLDDVRAQVAERTAQGRSQPRLAAVLVGNDPASEYYVRAKRRDAEEVGIAASDHRLPVTATTEEVLALINGLNQDASVSGILVQLPMPPQIDEARVIAQIDPARDADGIHPLSQGNLLLGWPGVVPCTPAGVIELLDRSQIPVAGANVVVVGRSNIVGKPTAILLTARHATVTICHSRTRDLAAFCRAADILVVAIGKAGFITADMVKPGSAVIDVGINRVDGKLVGDVDPEVAEVAGWLTPVPGGVGPMTRAMLVRNTLLVERARNG
ncbi:MAG TPA: bifunctional 5,10-methylenetetrahydrofolate dehydrogenase/5,10-methenyltetrahydrofolate cyclohydrolase [Candidatus Dormibacteraeota bacterium]|nr:bifunctional 5,10-methylenetetrahydrofolate dehydrogenase/5,10-methenyltetrahydrofolate cyclohydrolase [Candidatus Dormibacteraeota bacterium]